MEGSTLHNASPLLRCDRDFVVAALRTNGLALEAVPAALQSDQEVVLHAVTNNGMALQFASRELRNKKEIIHAAGLRMAKLCHLQAWKYKTTTT